MRSNCIKHCLNERLLNCIKNNRNYSQVFSHSIYWTSDLWTKEDFLDDQATIFNFNINQSERKLIMNCILISKSLKAECQLRCEKKCTNRYYNLYQQNPQIANYLFSRKATQIDISPSTYPDQITRHKPEMSPIEFFSAFGGLLGMWLGLSALAILKFSLNFF